MSIALITGSAGLIGSESCKFFHQLGFKIIGIDNDMRSYFFGKNASTKWNQQYLKKSLNNFHSLNIDIRNKEALTKVFKKYGKNISLVIHTAAQPSHDWAAKEPFTDFSVNANGTLNVLELTKLYAPDAVFLFTSTNKVYGDTPNLLPLIELEKRWEVAENHPYYKRGIDESMSIDQTKHSIFGASKVAADVMVQEYGRYFGMKTCVFRGGCLTGPSHSGTELHGFLSYIVKCGIENKNYTIYGYKGKQVRDNIHSFDLINAFYEYYKNPRPGAVYNMGGGRHSNCSVIEAIEHIQDLTGREFQYKLSDENRIGDHIWWISDVSKFQNDFPNWNYKYSFKTIIEEIYSNGVK